MDCVRRFGFSFHAKSYCISVGTLRDRNGVSLFKINVYIFIATAISLDRDV